MAILFLRGDCAKHVGDVQTSATLGLRILGLFGGGFVRFIVSEVAVWRFAYSHAEHVHYHIEAYLKPAARNKCHSDGVASLGAQQTI